MVSRGFDVHATVEEKGRDGGFGVERRYMQRRCAGVVPGFDVRAAIKKKRGDGRLCIAGRRQMERRSAVAVSCGYVCAAF